MRLKTVLREDELQITFTVSELTWLEVLLDCILNEDDLSGWKNEVERLKKILCEIKPEGQRMKRTTPEFENSEIEFKNDL